MFYLVLPSFAQQAAAPSQTALSEGVLLLREGHPAEAMQSLNAAVAASPRSADALTWRGICENQIGEFTAASRDLRAAVQLDAGSLPAHYNLALSLIRLRQIDGAITELRTVIRMQPEAIPARYNLAVLLEEKKDFPNAVEELRRAHGLADGDADVSLHLLEDLLRLHEESGLHELVDDLARSTVRAETQQQAGAALLEAAHFSEAATLLERAHAQAPAGKDTALLLARAYVGAGRDAQAISLLSETPETQTDEEMVYTAGLAHLGAGDRAAAVTSFEAAAALDPGDGRPLYHLALLSVGSENGRAKADTLLRRALQLDPDNRAFSLALARLLLATDDAGGAKTRLSAMTPQPADEVERSTLLGVALASTNELAKAIAQLKHAITLDPQLGLAQNVLGFCYFRGGDYKQAADAYHHASDLEPKRLLYARDAALAYLRAAAVDSAIHYAERAASLPDATPADDALLGKLYASAGRQDDAIRLLRRAAETDPTLDSAIYLLARTYQRMGKRDEANEWRQRLEALKAQHEASFVEGKKQAAAVQSSQVLAGGTVSDDAEDVE